MPRQPRSMNFPYPISARLSVEDHTKLLSLCRMTGRGPGAVLRLLLSIAQPTGLPQVTLAQDDAKTTAVHVA
jgi:hypothetical protein